MADRVIQLAVSESGSGSGAVFSFHLHLDGDVAASNQGLTVPQSQAVRELSTRYGSLFEQHRLPQLAREEQAAIGAQLFELWLAPTWQKLSVKLALGDQRILVIASDRASVLNLPWELLRPAGGEAVGADAKWSLRRLPWADRQLEAADGPLPAGPSRCSTWSRHRRIKTSSTLSARRSCCSAPSAGPGAGWCLTAATSAALRSSANASASSARTSST